MADKGNALREAAKAGDQATVEKLLAEGADINFKDRFGWTALHMAAMFGHTGLVRLLLQKGADPTITSNDGETAADVAKGMVLANEIRNFKK